MRKYKIAIVDMGHIFLSNGILPPKQSEVVVLDTITEKVQIFNKEIQEYLMEPSTEGEN